MIIGESESERQVREAQSADARRASVRWAKLTGEPIEYLDEFTYDPRDLARIDWAIGRTVKGRKPYPYSKPCHPQLEWDYKDGVLFYRINKPESLLMYPGQKK